MKYRYAAIIICAAIVSAACKKIDPHLDGTCSEPFVLTSEHIYMSSADDSVEIGINKDYWWISNVNWNGTLLKVYDTLGARAGMEFVYEHEYFTIVRKESNMLKIKCNRNAGNTENILFVQLQAGNCFGGFKLTQAAP